MTRATLPVQHSANFGSAGFQLRTATGRDGLLWMLLLAAAVGTAARISAGSALPFWFDEVFTGTIAAQRSFSGLVRWCLSELTGPAFYMPLWAWAKVAGTGNLALRAPAIAFAVLAPVLIAWRGHRDRDIRLCWAIMALLWLPILPMASEARPYPQLFFLAAVQAMLFMRAVESRDRGAVTAWAWVTAIAGLTHYYSLVIGAFQGFALLVMHRRSLLSLWPAAIPLAAMAVWMAVHLPFVLGFAAGRADEYRAMPLLAAATVPMMVFGLGPQGYVLFALIGGTARHWWKAVKLSPENLLVMTGVAALALLFVAGFFRPTFMPRYLTSTAPALLFGVACWAARMRRQMPLAAYVGFGALLAAMAHQLLAGPSDPRFRERRHFEFEMASAWIGERSPSRLAFLWSTSTGEQSDSGNLAEVAGFFLERSGRAAEVTVVRAGSDPNRALLRAASAHADSAILWVSDDRLPAGVRPSIERIDRTWECRDFGRDPVLVYACRRRAAPTA
jgi:hypothetical protein